MSLTYVTHITVQQQMFALKIANCITYQIAKYHEFKALSTLPW